MLLRFVISFMAVILSSSLVATITFYDPRKLYVENSNNLVGEIFYGETVAFRCKKANFKPIKDLIKEAIKENKKIAVDNEKIYDDYFNDNEEEITDLLHISQDLYNSIDISLRTLEPVNEN